MQKQYTFKILRVSLKSVKRYRLLNINLVGDPIFAMFSPELKDQGLNMTNLVYPGCRFSRSFLLCF